MRYTLIFALLLSSCSLFEGEKESPITGRWAQTHVAPHLVGICCSLNLNLVEEEGDIFGSGVIGLPSARTGNWNEISVSVTGSYDGTMKLVFESSSDSGALTAVPVEDEWYDMVASFSGFGASNDSMPIWKRD